MSRVHIIYFVMSWWVTPALFATPSLDEISHVRIEAHMQQLHNQVRTHARVRQGLVGAGVVGAAALVACYLQHTGHINVTPYLPACVAKYIEPTPELAAHHALALDAGAEVERLKLEFVRAQLEPTSFLQEVREQLKQISALAVAGAVVLNGQRVIADIYDAACAFLCARPVTAHVSVTELFDNVIALQTLGEGLLDAGLSTVDRAYYCDVVAGANNNLVATLEHWVAQVACSTSVPNARWLLDSNNMLYSSMTLLRTHTSALLTTVPSGADYDQFRLQCAQVAKSIQCLARALMVTT